MAPSDHRRLIAKILAAQDAEARARRQVAKMGRHVVELLARAREAGLADKDLARALLRRKHGKVTRSMKAREVERLRKRRRRGGTAGPALSTEGELQAPSAGVPSKAEVTDMPTLVRRTVTTTQEEYERDEDETDDESCDDDEVSASAKDEEEDEALEDEDEEDEAA